MSTSFDAQKEGPPLVPVFAEAKKRIGRREIENLLPGGEWKGSNYWVRSPLRKDDRPGSFNVGENGKWYDFSDRRGGSFIDLAAAVWNVTQHEAAQRIVKDFATICRPSRSLPSGKRKQPQASIPCPDHALRTLNESTKALWCQKKYGISKETYVYRALDGAPLYARVRFQKEDGSKNIIPFFYGKDDRWHAGAPPLRPGKFPLFKQEELSKHPDLPVVVVEGERCVSVAKEATKRYLFVTFGGSGDVSKHDFSPLKGRRVLIWPDADAGCDRSGTLLPAAQQPGLKAALEVKKRLPHAEILEVQKFAKKKSGYDVEDFLKETPAGLENFLSACPKRIESSPTEAPKGSPPNQHYRPIGWAGDTFYFFVSRGSIIKIGAKEFTKSAITSLAPPEHWEDRGFISKNGNLDFLKIQAALTREIEEAGLHDPANVRGTGVWKDDNVTLINSGGTLTFPEGRKVAVKDFVSRRAYITSPEVFSALAESPSTEEDGKQLRALFRAQGFSNPNMSDLTLGWALIAPFAGALDWRPHVWLTARRGSGKSFICEKLIEPLLGTFFHRGGPDDTGPGLWRTLDNKSIPVVSDEAFGDQSTKASSERLNNILRLARNACGNTSATRTIAKRNGDGYQSFTVRSMFLFASITAPGHMGAGIESRIASVDLKRKTFVEKQERNRETKRLLSVMAKAANFRRRIFSNLTTLVSEIETLRQMMLEKPIEERNAQQYAPLLAVVYRIQSNKPISRENQELFEFLQPLLDCIEEIASPETCDEDALMEALLQTPLITDGNNRRTVSELLKSASSLVNPSSLERKDAHALLQRSGFKLVKHKNVEMLAIARNHKAIFASLRDTRFSGGYDSFLKNNDCCDRDDGNGVVIKIAGASVRSRLFEWKQFRQRYLGEGLHESTPPSSGPSDDIPPSDIEPLSETGPGASPKNSTKTDHPAKEEKLKQQGFHWDLPPPTDHEKLSIPTPEGSWFLPY